MQSDAVKPRVGEVQSDKRSYMREKDSQMVRQSSKSIKDLRTYTKKTHNCLRIYTLYIQAGVENMRYKQQK